MNLSFLRNLDRGTLVFVMQRVLGVLLPMKPYAQCGIAPRCPCPSAPPGMTGVAIGDEVTMHLGDENKCPLERRKIC